MNQETCNNHQWKEKGRFNISTCKLTKKETNCLGGKEFCVTPDKYTPRIALFNRIKKTVHPALWGKLLKEAE